MAGVSNEQVVDTQKEAINAAAALAQQGKLNPAQADKFIDYVIDVTGLAKNARVIRFTNESMIIDKIGVGRRVAVPAIEGRDPGVRRGVRTSKVQFSPVEIMMPFEITDTFKEINVEGESVENHIIKMMATQLANDSEELYINGDKLGVAVPESDILDGGLSGLVRDSYLGLFDGWLRLCDVGTHVVDLKNANIGTTQFSKMLEAMPAKFKRQPANLRFLTDINSDQRYREKVGTRATAMGDAAIQGLSPMTPFGIPVTPFPLFPNRPRVVQHVQLNGTAQAALRYGPVANVVVTRSDLDAIPMPAYLETTDYVVDYDTGKINRTGNGAITDQQVVKVTYDANPQIILTHFQNLIVAFGRDVRIEKDRDIFKRVNQYAVTFKVAVALEEPDAVVKGINLGTGV